MDDFDLNMKVKFSSVKSLKLRRIMFVFWEASGTITSSQNSKHSNDVPIMASSFGSEQI